MQVGTDAMQSDDSHRDTCVRDLSHEARISGRFVLVELANTASVDATRTVASDSESAVELRRAITLARRERSASSAREPGRSRLIQIRRRAYCRSWFATRQRCFAAWP